MHVLVVTSMYPTASAPYNGTYVSDQVRGLRSAGIDVDVLFINAHKSRLQYGTKVASVVRKLRSTPYDLVHTHHTYSLLTVELARRLARSRVPIVLTNHESEITDTEHRSRTWHPSSYLRHWLPLKRFAARRADFVILVSSGLSTVIAPDARHEVIPCGMDMAKFRPLDRDACRERLGIPPEAQMIFFSGRPAASYKGFSLARATYEILQRRLPHALLVTGGNIPYEEMPLYFNAADVVLQTSFCEASPTVVKEALACEVPLVSTDVGDTREITSGVPYCFVCPSNSTELANRVVDCIGHRAVGGRQQLLAKGIALDQVTARVIQVYRRLM